jgi:hypothetical protein
VEREKEKGGRYLFFLVSVLMSGQEFKREEEEKSYSK